MKQSFKEFDAVRAHPISPRLHLTHTPLPAPDLELAACAHDLAELGAWLLASSSAVLLAITLRADQRDPAMPVMLWGANRLPDADLASALAAPTYRFGAVLKAAERAADRLLLALSPRWPAATPPSRLGIVTDGTGVGFCPDDPSPLASGWMTRQQRDAHRLTCLLPFATNAVWHR